MSLDIRWRQRFDNYQRALQTLSRAVALSAERPLSELEQQGLVVALARNEGRPSFTVSPYFAQETAGDKERTYGVGFSLPLPISGRTRDAIRTAFKNGLLEEGETWMEMIKARNLSSHTYQLELANRLAAEILQRFYPAFVALEQKMQELVLREAP